jgi:hypothetical protein
MVLHQAREARDKSNEQLRELFDPSLFDESQLKQMKTCLDIGLRVCLVEKNWVKSYCTTFRCYLVKFVQPWIN